LWLNLNFSCKPEIKIFNASDFSNHIFSFNLSKDLFSIKENYNIKEESTLGKQSATYIIKIEV
jgi:hypothetical protein